MKFDLKFFLNPGKLNGTHKLKIPTLSAYKCTGGTEIIVWDMYVEVYNKIIYFLNTKQFTVIIIIKCYNINIVNVIEKCYSINIVASLFNYRAIFLILVIVLFSVFYFLSEKYFKLHFLEIIQKVWIFILKKGRKFSNVHISKVRFTKCSNVWLHRSYIIIIILLNYEMLISAKSKSWRS